MNMAKLGRLNEEKLSYESVSEVFGYDDLFAELYYKKDMKHGTIKAGSPAIISKNRYQQVRIGDSMFSVHRVIWLLVYGRWPIDQIDHIDGNPFNNSIDNLREVSQLENNRNKKLCRNSTSGITGVYFDKRYQKWYGQIWVEGKHIYSKGYHAKSKAAAWRRRAERRYGFFINHRRIETK